MIADSDPLARRVIRDVLQDDHRFIIPGEAATGVEAVELCEYYTPEACLMELDLQGPSPVGPMEQIVSKVPEVKILVFSRTDGIEHQLDVLAAGAAGFISKNADTGDVVAALKAVIDGKAVVPQATAMRLIERLRELPDGGVGMRPVSSGLTQREWEVLDLLSQSLDTREMADRLVISEDTIYSHVKNVLRKLGVHSRNEAVEVAKGLRGSVSGMATQVDDVSNGPGSEYR